MDDLDKLAKALTEAQRRALSNATPVKTIRGTAVHFRAGDLFPGAGNVPHIQEWLKETSLFERYFHVSHFAYRLTPLGLALKAHIERTTHAE